MTRNCPLCGSFMAYIEDDRGDYWRCKSCGHNEDASFEDQASRLSKKG